MVRPAANLTGGPRAAMLAVFCIAALVPVGAGALVLSFDSVCNGAVTAEDVSALRRFALLSWAGSLVIVGAAIWSVGRLGYSVRDRRILWGVFGIWKLMALGFALSVGVPCWDSYAGMTGTMWEVPAAVLTLAMWVVLLFCLLVLIVVGPKGRNV